MTVAIHRLIFFVLSFGLSAVVWCHDLGGQWDLKIEDQNRHVVTALVIEFTERQAQSCIGGKWLRVNVSSSTTEDSRFFPLSDPLSYSVENNQLTIGRNEVCDAYLWLRGEFDNEITLGNISVLGGVASHSAFLR